MNREIQFRGLRTDGKGWVEGDLVQDCDLMKDECSHYYETAIIDDGEVAEVHPHTVGQFTGLLDKNGVKVFEGDLVSFYLDWIDKYAPEGNEIEQDTDEVFWDGKNCKFSLKQSEDYHLEPRVFMRNYMVIGNIHEAEAQS